MENWKEIRGYEGLYQISDLGNVKSVARVRVLPTGGIVKMGDKIKTPTVVKGYLYVNLCKESRKKKFKIHRLVAQHFIPNPENKSQVNHKEGNKKDNRWFMLEWATGFENMKHAYDHGLLTMPDNRGENNGRSKLSAEEVGVIRTSYPESSYQKLANKYSVSKVLIGKIIRNESWVSSN